MFLHGRTVYGRGCLNEPFRMLSGLSDEGDLADLSTQPVDGPAVTAAVRLTLSHAATCVPIVLEDPRTLQLVRHWFPQLSGAFKTLRHMNAGSVKRCKLTDDTRAVLSELAAAESIVYDVARQRVEVMLAALPKKHQR